MKKIENKRFFQNFRFWERLRLEPFLKLSILALGLMCALAGCDLGGGGVSSPGGGGITGTGPATPSGVTAYPLSSTEIFVTWNPVSGASKYNVYWAENASGPYDFDGFTYAGTTSFISPDWFPGGTGYFRVTAVNNAGESPMSPYVYATALSAGAGSSSSNPIPLSSSLTAWRPGILSFSSPEVWYSINVGSTTDWYLAGRDKDSGNFTYTGDVRFEIYNSSLSLYTSIDAGKGGDTYSNLSGNAGTHYINTWPYTGTWYVRVIPYGGNTSNYGNYAIYFY
jgi:hypothetical protein